MSNVVCGLCTAQTPGSGASVLLRLAAQHTLPCQSTGGRVPVLCRPVHKVLRQGSRTSLLQRTSLLLAPLLPEHCVDLSLQCRRLTFLSPSCLAIGEREEEPSSLLPRRREPRWRLREPRLRLRSLGRWRSGSCCGCCCCCSSCCCPNAVNIAATTDITSFVATGERPPPVESDDARASAAGASAAEPAAVAQATFDGGGAGDRLRFCPPFIPV